MTLSIKFLPHPTLRARISLSAGVMRRLLGWPGRVMAARRILRDLGGLSDHELRDIGLYRHDLRDASALAPDTDPSLMLRRRVETRRLWR